MGNDERVEIACITKGDADYPPALTRCLGDQAPTMLTAIGNRDLLARQVQALFCSVKCPGTVILRTYDLALSLRNAGATVIGGFQSPMEREFLTLLLRGSGPVIVCPARDIGGIRIPREWRAPLSEGRLLVLSSFGEGQRRATDAQATARNFVVAALADEVLIPYAEGRL
jgi:predicted Rossmann fold nucleotide-binding protein DprA/Smf involved in DNA uptake